MRKTLETAINGLKLWTERLVKRSADEVRGEIPAIPTPKQADWNQNDDTAIDHIKGRTHYERIGFKQIPIGTYNDHAPGYTDYNVGPYAWDYTNGITLRVDGVVYEFETFTKSDFDSNLGCYGYWVGAPLVRGQIADSSEYPFHFRIFEKDNEYAHVEFADGTDNHTFEVFCTEIKQLDEKYIPDSIARKSDIPQGGGTSDIPDTLPNPHPLTFTGAVEATYDGSTPVEVEIPMGGSGGGETGGGFGLGVADNYDIELITEVYNIDKENMPTRIDITQKDDGTPFAYDGIILWTDVKDTYSYSTVLFNNTSFMQSNITHGDKTRMNLFITDGTTMLYYYNNQPIRAFVMKQSRADVDDTFEPNVHIKNLPEKFTAVSLGAVSAITSITFYKVWGLKKK